MSYPSVFCLKCKNHTDTLGRHTIQLSNNRRALKGVCPVCATETYRFMPAKTDATSGGRETQLSLISSQRKLPTKGRSAASPSAPRSALISKFKPQAHDLSRVDFVHYGTADKLLHYGVLMVLFGLSAVIGYLVCAEFLIR